MTRGRHYIKPKPGDVYRSMASLMLWGPWVIVVVSIAGFVLAWLRGAESRLVAPTLVVPVVCNIGAWWLARRSRPLILRNAEMADREWADR